MAQFNKNNKDHRMLGLIAGSGLLPVLAARKANLQNIPLAVFAVSEHTHAELKSLAQVFLEGGAGEVNRALRFLDENNCQNVLFMGKVEKHRIFRGLKLDWGAIKLLSQLKDRSDTSIMLALVELLESHGHKVLSQAEFLPELLAPSGPVNQVRPTAPQKRDLEHGFRIAKQLSQIGVGQTVVLKRGMVLAVEAIEGTDESIKRGCELGGKGAVVVKVSQPSHDPRFDMPTVGRSTLVALINGKAAALGLETGKVLMVGQEEMIDLAEKNHLAITGLDSGES